MNTYMNGYRLGVSAVRIYRKTNWATGKGKIKKVIKDWIKGLGENKSLSFEASKGFIDALLDSVN